MARRAFRTAASAAEDGTLIPGVYALLLVEKRDSYARNRVDPRWYFTEAGSRGEPPPESVVKQPGVVLLALEAGEAVTVSSYQLPGSLVSREWIRVNRGRWFEVRPDDTVRRCDPAV